MPFGFLLRVGFYGRDHMGSPLLLPTGLSFHDICPPLANVLCGCSLNNYPPKAVIWRTSVRLSQKCNPGDCRHSRNGNLWNICSSIPHQSGLMPANLITLPHLSVSSDMNFPKAADVIGIGSAPKANSRAFILGSARVA